MELQEDPSDRNESQNSTEGNDNSRDASIRSDLRETGRGHSETNSQTAKVLEIASKKWEMLGLAIEPLKEGGKQAAIVCKVIGPVLEIGSTVAEAAVIAEEQGPEAGIEKFIDRAATIAIGAANMGHGLALGLIEKTSLGNAVMQQIDPRNESGWKQHRGSDQYY